MFLYKTKKASAKLYESPDATTEGKTLGLPGSLFVGDGTEINGRLKVTFEGETTPEWWINKEFLLDLGEEDQQFELARLADAEFFESAFTAASVVSGFRDAGGMNAEYLLLLAWSESGWTNSDTKGREGDDADQDGRFGPFRFDKATWEMLLQDNAYESILKGYTEGDRLIPEAQSFFAACLANRLQVALTRVLGSEPAAWMLRVGHRIGEPAVLRFARLKADDAVSTTVKDAAAISPDLVDANTNLFVNGSATTREQVLAVVKAEFDSARQAILERLGALVKESTLDDLAGGLPVSRSLNTLRDEDIKPYSSLLDFIAKGEGGYNSMNNGTSGNLIVDSTHDSTTKIGRLLTEMTLAEIMAMQEGSRSSGRKLFAVGRYQIIPETMKFAVRKAEIAPDTLFTEKTQDKLAVTLILKKQPKLGDYLQGKNNDLEGAMLQAAKEWASLPDPSTGNSFFGSGNKAQHSVAEVRAALIAARKEISGTDMASV